MVCFCVVCVLTASLFLFDKFLCLCVFLCFVHKYFMKNARSLAQFKSFVHLRILGKYFKPLNACVKKKFQSSTSIDMCAIFVDCTCVKSRMCSLRVGFCIVNTNTVL